MIELRDYQQRSVEALRAAFGQNRRVLFQLQTGGGKTVVFSYITASTLERGNSVLIVVHRAEILRQIGKTLEAFGIEHGVIAAGCPTQEARCQLGMVQTVANRLDSIQAPQLIIFDEAHHATCGSYRKITERFPTSFVLGVSATPCRLDGRPLNNVFDTLVLGEGTRSLMDRGYLADYRYLAPPTQIDTKGLKTSMGDYSLAQLAQETDKSTITGDAVSYYRQHLDGKPVACFCVTLAHARHVAQAFTDAGYAADTIDGQLSEDERKRRVADLASGDLQILTSCELISEGFDLPCIQGVILLRPTKSLSLYRQQVGRALRPKPDGSKAVILDHVGNVLRHGLPDEDVEWSLSGKAKRKQERTPTTCKVCFGTSYSGMACEREDCPQNRAAAERDGPEYVAGVLAEVDKEALKALRKAELKAAKTYGELVALGRSRNYRYPEGWATHIMEQRVAWRTGWRRQK